MAQRFLIVAALLAALAGPASASTFAVETSAFLNQGAMPKLDAAAAEDCGGRNVSPPLHLSGFPVTTRSFGVVVLDTDAGRGRGFTHWVAYGIAPAQTSLLPGFGSHPSPAFTGGRNDAGTDAYFGPCPPKGDPPHHYVFTVYALDLAPGRLKPGLTRPAFLRAIGGHTLATADITGRYAR